MKNYYHWICKKTLSTYINGKNKNWSGFKIVKNNLNLQDKKNKIIMKKNEEILTMSRLIAILKQ